MAASVLPGSTALGIVVADNSESITFEINTE
jgi:hypothetical protein